MSGAVDEDTARAVASGRETIGGILSTAQRELQKVFIIFVVGFFGTFTALRWWIWDWLEAMTLSGMNAETAEDVEIIVTTPFEVILLQAKIGIIVGILIALPALLFLSRRDLKERGRWPDLRLSRWTIAGLAVLVVALFVVGIVYAYWLFFPIMFNFLAAQAISVGVVPSYGIVQWTEFLVLLTLSFGLAAQLPLLMTAASHGGIVEYETFRDKWKYAILIIFGFGALFSPPDPFTMFMWAVPLIALYVFSLALSKITTNIKRREASGTTHGRFGVRAGVIAVVGFGIVVGAASGLAIDAGALDVLYTDVRPRLPELVQPAEPIGLGAWLESYGSYGPLVGGVLAGTLAMAVPVVLYVVAVLRRPVHPPLRPEDPTEIDIGPLSADRVADLPDDVFADMTEAEATGFASDALDAGNEEKARLIFNRFDGTADDADAPSDESAEESDESGVIAGTATGMMSALSEDSDEEDIGGYLEDIRFVAGSLRSRMFHIFAVFGVVIAAVFTFLAQGGLRYIKADFISRMPDGAAEEISVITLHPAEYLIFIVKFSTIAAVLSVVPMLLYYAWPSMTELGWIEARRGIVYKWTAGTLLALAAGTALGYFVIAPGIMSYLVYDAVRHGMVVSYQISSFSWLIIFTTVGIGLFMIIPFTMWMLYRGGMATYGGMRDRWREVTIAAFAFAGVFTPASVLSMFLVGIPVMLFYWFGLVGLWIVTFGGRRGRDARPEAA